MKSPYIGMCVWPVPDAKVSIYLCRDRGSGKLCFDAIFFISKPIPVEFIRKRKRLNYDFQILNS